MAHGLGFVDEVLGLRDLPSCGQADVLDGKVRDAGAVQGGLKVTSLSTLLRSPAKQEIN